MKNRTHKYEINRPRHRHGHKYVKYKMCLIIIMIICIKQHRTIIGSSIHEKVSNTHRGKFCFTQFSARMAALLLLVFSICLHDQLTSINSIITY